VFKLKLAMVSHSGRRYADHPLFVNGSLY